MKINKFIIPICGLALTMLTTTSCSWFDVNPKTDVEAEDLFSTPDGFESALAGIYIASTERQAYGDNWTFGFMDKLVQSYDNIPQTENASTIYDYTRSGGSKDTQASMWQRSYFLIANANNLLRWLDKNGETVIVNEEQKRMLRERHWPGELSCILTCCVPGDRFTRTIRKQNQSLTARWPTIPSSLCFRLTLLAN